MEGLPHLFDFEGEMAHYTSLEEEIQELPEVRHVGAILLSTGEYPALDAPVTGTQNCRMYCRMWEFT